MPCLGSTFREGAISPSLIEAKQPRGNEGGPEINVLRDRGEKERKRERERECE